MSVTDKFSKRVTFVPGRTDWTARQWAVALIRELADWGIPLAIISDRDTKFVSDLWRQIFKSLSVKLLLTTSWHPESDGQSERTN